MECTPGEICTVRMHSVGISKSEPSNCNCTDWSDTVKKAKFWWESSKLTNAGSLAPTKIASRGKADPVDNIFSLSSRFIFAFSKKPNVSTPRMANGRPKNPKPTPAHKCWGFNDRIVPARKGKPHKIGRTLPSHFLRSVQIWLFGVRGRDTGNRGNFV